MILHLGAKVHLKWIISAQFVDFIIIPILFFRYFADSIKNTE